MPGNLQVRSQGKHWSQALNILLGIQKQQVMKIFSHVRLTCKSLIFMVEGYPSKKSQIYGNPFTLKIFKPILKIVGQSKMMLINFKKTFQNLGSEYFLRTDLEVSRHFLFYKFETNRMWLKDSKNTFENYTQNQKNHVYVIGTYIL
jgi:hypothetical protein